MEKIYKIGDIIECQFERYKIYFPCQVVKLRETKDNWVALLALNFFSKEKLKISDLTNIKPLYCTHHYWKRHILAFWIETQNLNDFKIIGKLDKIFEIQDNEIKNVPEFWNIKYQYLWQILSEDIQENFKNIGFKAPYKLGKIPLTISELEKIKQENYYTHEINSNYFDKTLQDFLKKNPLIIHLNLKENLPKIIDLSGTKIIDLNINIDNVEEIILNEHIENLNLSGNFSKLKKIICPFEGKYLFLNIKTEENINFLPKLEKLEQFRIDFKWEFYIKILSKVSKNIEDIYIMGKSANIKNEDELKIFRNLKFLWLSDVYGFKTFPKKENFPNLKNLILWSIPKVVGDKIKKEYKNFCELDIKQLRTEEWIKANLNNPLKWWDWRDIQRAKAKNAMKAYINAYKILNKKDLDKNWQKIILKDFLKVFNEIEQKYGLDTLETEEILEAFIILWSLTDFTENELNNIFEKTLEL